MLTKIFAPLIASSPGLKRTIWKRWYQFLAGGYQIEDWTFMNYGFAELESGPPTLALEAADEPNRYSIQLYQQVVSDVDLKGLHTLEVGSGRGGGSSYLARYQKPSTMVGIDYSEKAVELSRKVHKLPNLQFQKGDAEALPFQDGTFDAIVNVESSHCYGSMEGFLAEVLRVLKPGGYFLWADMRAAGDRENIRTQFEGAGLSVQNQVEITPNVVAGLDQVNDRKRETISKHVPRYLHSYFEDFAGVQGTRVYESLKAGKVEYWRCTARKPL